MNILNEFHFANGGLTLESKPNPCNEFSYWLFESIIKSEYFKQCKYEQIQRLLDGFDIKYIVMYNNTFYIKQD